MTEYPVRVKALPYKSTAGQNTFGPGPMIEWCKENDILRFDWDWNWRADPKDPSGIRFAFRNQNDAILFKLRWC